MIELRGITWDHPRGYQPLAASAELYAARFGVRVEWEKRSLKDFGDAPIDALAERYDLLIMDHPHVGVAAASRCLLPLDEYLSAETLTLLAEQSAGPSHASYFYEGHQWGLAVDAAMQASAYRPDLVQPPFPKTWEEVIAYGVRLKSAGQIMAIPLVPTDAICSFLSLCASLGDPPGRDGKLVSDITGRRVLELLLEFKSVSHSDSLNWNPIALLNHMSQNDDVAYCPLIFCYTNYSRAGYAPQIVRFTNIPGVRGTLLGGTGFAVSARCQFPAEACAYGAWLCSADIQRTLYVENGGQPGNAAAWTDDAANRLTNGFFHDTLDTLNTAYVRPRHEGYPIFQEAAGRVIYGLLNGESSAAACFERLTALYEASLQDVKNG